MKELLNGSPFSRVPFFRITLVFVMGILVARFMDLTYWKSYYILLLLVGSYVVFFLAQLKMRRYKLGPLFGLVGLSALFMAGYICFLQKNPMYNMRHLVHVTSDVTMYEGVVVSEVQHKRMKEVIVAVRRVCVKDAWKKVSGKVKLEISHKKNISLDYGSVLLVYGRPEAMIKPSNPYEVDYNGQWYVQGVFHKQKVIDVEAKGYDYPSRFIKMTLQMRCYCTEKLRSYFTEEEAALGVVLALVLGVRSDLKSDVRDVYVQSGVMHVLAVSGLHVGLLYTLLLLLFYLLGWLFGSPGQYRFLALIFLWVYAFITGLSPSVLRAVGILSLIVLARWLQRDYHVINLLSAVAFFLLLYNPYFLFDLGFQLSFAAMFGIVTFYTPIAMLYTAENRYLRYWWQMTSVSLAAQIGTMPISMYYFHSFPTYFLLANWVMLPLAMVFLSLGGLILLFFWWPWGAAITAWLLERIVMVATKYLGYLSELPYGQIELFRISIWEIITYYAILSTLYIGIKKRRFLYLCMATGLICGSSGLTVYRNMKQKSQKCIIVYDVAPNRVVCFIEGNKATLVGDQTLQKCTSYYKYKIKPSLDRLGIEKVNQSAFYNTNEEKNFFHFWEGVQLRYWQQKYIVVVDKNCPGPPLTTSPFHIDLLVVEEDAVEDLTPWLMHCSIGLLVIGSSNTTGKKLALQASEHHIKYHDITEKGAFVHAFIN